MRWNDIPFDEDASPEIKALEFDLQHEENAWESKSYEVLDNDRHRDMHPRRRKWYRSRPTRKNV